MNIYFDIETISDYGNHGTEQLQAKYEDRLPFQPEYNQILTICVGRDGEQGSVVKALEGDEESQIKAFYDLVPGNTLI
jgi:hypothetical protein